MKRVLLLLIVVFAAASFLTRPDARQGKPMLAGASIPPAVLAKIDAACRDCHSDVTRYPWYSYVAPVSMLVNRDIEKGRERLNLSHWAEYTPVRRQRALTMMANQVQDGEMPLAIYTWLHREAALSDTDRKLIFEWTQAEKRRLIEESLH